MQKIIEGTAPDKFSNEHLKGLGFKSSNDRAIIPLLKDLGFLSEDGTPTQRYHEFRDASRSKIVMAEALRDAYGDLFHIKEKLAESDRKAIQGKLKTTHNVSDKVAELQTSTFFSLLKLADLDAVDSRKKKAKKEELGEPPEVPPEKPPAEMHTPPPKKPLSLRYNIEIHLPATKDVEVYNAIFKALKVHLGE
jgi:hypothetical protein